MSPKTTSKKKKTKQDFEAIAEQMDWDRHSELSILKDFIETRGLWTDAVKFAKEVAKVESEQIGYECPVK